MKKLLALTLAVLLVCSLALPAAASDEKTMNLTIEYSATNSPEYEFEIPASTKINENAFDNYGMVTVTNTKNFWNYELQVTAELSQFTGTKGRSFQGQHKWLIDDFDEDGNLDVCGGNETVVTMYFREIINDETGELANKAVDENHNEIKGLAAYCPLSGFKAPSDTYIATVTFTAEPVVITE